MKNVSEQKLLECLDLMDSGLPVAEILARYPEQADALRPFLDTAVQLSNLAVNPTIGQQNKSQEAFLAQAAAMKTGQNERLPLWVWLRRLLFPVAALSLLLILFGAGIFTLSASALPGDNLYGWKRQFEGLQLQMVSSPDDKLELVDQFNLERQREVTALLLAGRSEETGFDGVVEMIDAETWVVSNIPVWLLENTVIAGTPQINAWVRVTGFTDNGRFFANRIEILTAAPSDPEVLPEVAPTETAAPTVTETAAPTQTPQPTETAVATATQEPTQTPTSTPTSTNTPEATETPQPTETAVPTNTLVPSPPPTSVPDDNSNDNDDSENENDNGDDNNNDNDDSNDNNDDDAEVNDNGDDSSDDNDNDNDNSNDDNDNENDDDDDSKNDND